MAEQTKLGWSSADVMCPFYLSHSAGERSIRCEGPSEGAELISRFRSRKKKESHMGSYCVGRYERCPVYKCTYKAKYDD